ARPNPDEQAEGQAGPNPGDAAASQPLPSHVVHAGPILEHMDFEVVDVLTQPHPEQMDEGFTVTAYPKVQENLKLTVEKQPSEADNEKTTAKTEAESMVSITIQLDTSVIPPMTTLVVDLTSRPESPNVYRPLQAMTTEITTTLTTTIYPPPSQPQQSTTDSVLMKRIAHKKKKKRRDLPKTPPGSPPHQPPPRLPPAGPSGASGSLGASGSSQVLPPPPPLPPSTNQEGQSQGSAAPSSSKTAASAEYQAWTTIDTRLRTPVSLTPADLQTDDDMDPDA
nr:hypothetical protein [Tanacetum cinerariifolium]GEY11466.1 hypothetical protein [Tanacetum cinerariifolium]